MSYLFILILFFTIKSTITQNKSELNCLNYIGISASYNQVPAVIGGTPSARYQFPYMAALIYGNTQNRSFHCGGSLISAQFILTAAHCTTNKRIGPVKWARLGTINLNPNNTDYQDFTVIEQIKHPRYKPPHVYHDIALLKLKDLVLFTPSILPACLNIDPYIMANRLVAMGWGKLDYTGSISMKLMHVELELFSYENCQKIYENSGRQLPAGIVDSLQLCAGSANFNQSKDTCQGDSGGPIILPTFDVDTIVGVTSFGKACGLVNTPGVYTKIATYVPWIEQIVWN